MKEKGKMGNGIYEKAVFRIAGDRGMLVYGYKFRPRLAAA